MTESGVTVLPGFNSSCSTRPDAWAVSQRKSLGTSTPGPRTWRMNSPRRTVSIISSERLTDAAIGSRRTMANAAPASASPPAVPRTIRRLRLANRKSVRGRSMSRYRGKACAIDRSAGARMRKRLIDVTKRIALPDWAYARGDAFVAIAGRVPHFKSHCRDGTRSASRRSRCE